jgi:cysteine desulfuration protein SufE
MSSETYDLPGRLGDICEDFALCEGREKLELLLQYAESMPTLDGGVEADRRAVEEVPECMTPVLIQAHRADGGLGFRFEIPENSPTVRGFASVLSAGLEGLPPREIIAVQDDLFRCMQLEGVLSFQRMRGFSAMLAHIKRLALVELEKENDSGSDAEG